MTDDRGAAASLAGGGVVWRPDPDAPDDPARVQVAVAHRPRYDDWSLPKGKLDRDESVLGAAVREVHEEIGAQVLVGPRLSQIEYPIQRGGQRVLKRVAYWSMRYTGGRFCRGDEVDELAWVPPTAAARLLSYGRDRQVLQSFARSSRHDRSVVLVRHARAGKRREWRGDDALRPLDAIGEAQAGRLGTQLARLSPTAVLSADRTRCIETVAPLARRLGLTVQVDSAYTDDSFTADPEQTITALTRAAPALACVVVCSQGETIPGLIAALAPEVADTATRKAAFWLLSLDGERVVGADYYEDALQPRP